MLIRIDYAFCEPESILALLARWIIHTGRTLLVLTTGLAYVMNDAAYVFLLIWTYIEATFIFTVVQQAFKQAKPPCSLTDDPLLSKMRDSGMPSEEVFYITMATAFLLTNQMLVRQVLPFGFEKFLLIMVPLSIVCMFLTRNATGMQVIVGLIFGGVMGLRASIVYQFVLKYQFLVIREFFKLSWLIPGGNIRKIYNDTDSDDLDTSTLFLSPEFEKFQSIVCRNGVCNTESSLSEELEVISPESSLDSAP